MTPASRDHALSDTQKLWLALPGNRRTQAQDFPVLRVEDLTGEGFIDLSLEIRAGEIVGLAGLVGSGRTEFAETSTACVRRAPGGSGWRTARSAATARARLASGLVYLPEDRQVSGLFLDAPVRWNTVMFNQPSWWQQQARSGGGGALSPGAGDQAGRWRSARCARSPAVTSRRCCWRAVWRLTRCC
jgi:AI-2 transport system ATP-binding protein